MKAINIIITVLSALICTTQLFAQEGYKVSGKEQGTNNRVNLQIHSEENFRLDDSRTDQQFLRDIFEMSEKDEWKIQKQIPQDELGYTHKRFQLFHEDIPVEFHYTTVHVKNNRIMGISGMNPKIKISNVNPSLSAEKALETAIDAIGAKLYAWDNVPSVLFEGSKHGSKLPVAELVICRNFTKKNAKFLLAYKFEICAYDPYSITDVYIDAHSGECFLKIPQFITCYNGSAATRYSGSQNIATSSQGGKYILECEEEYYGIHTVNANHSGIDNPTTEFTDGNNNWTSAEFNNSEKDNAALDAHFGAEVTLEYFLEEHGRYSYDNQGASVENVIHFGSYFENAGWFGNRVKYGDGNPNGIIGTDPWTSLDIVAHEIAHGVCDKTADLAYLGETGALNEGFSDLWSACVEQYANNDGLTYPQKSPWLIADEIMTSSIPFLRSMSNPSSSQLPEFLKQPDTYGGSYWVDPTDIYSDYGGVHVNSGVFNKWFYILCQGESGTNDHGTYYNVSGIGMDKAADIAYRAERIYLGPIDGFLNARIFTIQAAKDLYGTYSTEASRVQAAWNAVGVYSSTAENCFADQSITEDTEYECENLFLGCRVALNSNLTATAENEITMLPGFEITTGSTFDAIIE